jgi:serine/threonine protein kinase
VSRSFDALLERVLVRNRLVEPAAVGACLRELAGAQEGDAGLGQLLLERGLLTPTELHAAERAARLVQARRYLALATASGMLDQERADALLASYRHSGYRETIAHLAVAEGSLSAQQSREIVEQDPLTLGDALAASGDADSPTGHRAIRSLDPLLGTARTAAQLLVRDGVVSVDELARVIGASVHGLTEAAQLLDAAVGAGLLAHVHRDQVLGYLALDAAPPPFRLGDYLLVAPLGFARTGPVYRAIRGGAEGTEPATIALEVLTPPLAADPVRVARLRARASLVRLPPAAGLARTVELGEDGEVHYLARVCALDDTLATRLAGGRTLSPDEAMRMAREVAGALMVLADAGVVHGAVRPENIAFLADGAAMLQDVGATPAPTTFDPDEAVPCADLPVWLAPEQLRPGGTLDPRTDVYGLGCCIFAALAGVAPYRGATSAEVMRAVLRGARLDLREVVPGLPPALVRLVHSLMEPHLLARPGGPDALLGRLSMLAPLGSPRPHPAAPAAADPRPPAAPAAPTPAPAAPPLPPGVGAEATARIAGRYQVVRRLGAGAMGVVYEAQDERLGRLVAVKTLRRDLVKDAHSVMRLEREVLAESALRHPHIVQVYDAGEDTGPDGPFRYVVLELVDGPDVRSVLDEEGQLRPGRAARIARGVLMALEEAHARGVIHRDLKPENIMLWRGAGAHEIAKVMDFGLAKFVAQSGVFRAVGSKGVITSRGGITGTPQYMAPEQALEDAVLDGRADLYSLGIVVFEMVTGTLPLQSDTALGYLGQHAFAKPLTFSEARPDLSLPDGLQQLVARALAKDPADRYPDAADMRRDLEQRCGALLTTPDDDDDPRGPGFITRIRRAFGG